MFVAGVNHSAVHSLYVGDRNVVVNCVFSWVVLVIRSGTLFLMASSGADAVSVVTRKIRGGVQFLQTPGF